MKKVISTAVLCLFLYLLSHNIIFDINNNVLIVILKIIWIIMCIRLCLVTIGQLLLLRAKKMQNQVGYTNTQTSNNQKKYYLSDEYVVEDISDGLLKKSCNINMYNESDKKPIVYQGKDFKNLFMKCIKYKLIEEINEEKIIKNEYSAILNLISADVECYIDEEKGKKIAEEIINRIIDDEEIILGELIDTVTASITNFFYNVETDEQISEAFESVDEFLKSIEKIDINLLITISIELENSEGYGVYFSTYTKADCKNTESEIQIGKDEYLYDYDNRTIETTDHLWTW